MVRINEHYLTLTAGYLFPEIARRVAAFTRSHPQAQVIRLGIGDVVRALPRPIVAAMKAAAEEMAHDDTFRGYPPEQGYDFLREAIVAGDFAPRGVRLAPDEVFVSDGAKCDSGNIQEIFGLDNVVALTDPVYPVYCDSNVMAGRTGPSDATGRYEGLVYLPCTAENGFVPPLPERHVDLIYLCSPNNPTGVALRREDLQRWVEYAHRERAVILFDAAYEAYITDPAIPHSIYEIDGARAVAIEFRSFSKTAGFTGLRCAYTVVPHEVTGCSSRGEVVELHRLWLRRHATKFNGVAYPVQRAAAAVYSPTGAAAIRQIIAFYLENARLLREGLGAQGFAVYGGIHAPYLWLRTPSGEGSWSFFDRLLAEAHVVGTPGAGFGAAGEGYLRLSAFNRREQIEAALERIGRLSR